MCLETIVCVLFLPFSIIQGKRFSQNNPTDIITYRCFSHWNETIPQMTITAVKIFRERKSGTTSNFRISECWKAHKIKESCNGTLSLENAITWKRLDGKLHWRCSMPWRWIWMKYGANKTNFSRNGKLESQAIISNSPERLNISFGIIFKRFNNFMTSIKRH